MALYTGAKSSLKLGIEDTFGTAASLKYKIPFTSESLNYTLETIRSEALLGLRGTKSIAPGKIGASGSVSLEMYPSSIGVLFYLALGKATANANHTLIEPIGVTEDLPSATIEVSHAGEKFLFLGQKVNSLSLTANVDSIASLSVDFVGKKAIAEAGTEETIMVEIDDDPYYFKEILLYDNEDLNIPVDTMSELTLTIANNLNEDDYRLDGTGERKTIEPGQLEITGSMNIIFDANLLTGKYKDFVQFNDIAIGAKFEKASEKKFTIVLPRVKLTNLTHDIDGPGTITVSADYEAVLNSAGKIIQVKDYTIIATGGSY